MKNIEFYKNKVLELSRRRTVVLKRTTIDNSSWFYNNNTGHIQNNQGTFFQISGVVKRDENSHCEQPIILQPEIGYLGIIRQKQDNEYCYLMQYKIEPGNVNKIQISPTIQATKSNFTQKHGGKKPAYLDYFLNASDYRIVVDQIQSEQSSRFLGKRNRNIIIEIPENEKIEVFESHDWMTLKQLKELMRLDNIVNMDTRTVLSCLPFSVTNYNEAELAEFEGQFSDKALFNSIIYGNGKNIIPEIYQYINNYKMFDKSKTELVPLYSLENWEMKNDEFVCKYPYSFKVVFYEIEIEGREVRHWSQPLFEAMGVATFGLFTCVENDVRLFLVKCRSEIGCFDKMELGPTIQREFISTEEKDNVELHFDKMLAEGKGVIFDTLLSEEGGRFYQEQNRNIIIQTDKQSVELPPGYFWCDYKTLNTLIQVNNVLNIQLRNLLSVLEF